MAGTFGGYGLPLQGQLPAELTGTRRYALGEENTLAPASPGGEDEPEELVRDNNLVKAIAGRTWSGIEYGEAPLYAYSFCQYADAVRGGDLALFKRIEEETSDWWFPTLDRGAGAALHFAVDHGQLEMVKFLVEERGAEVNQQDRKRGWTPIHRAARMAHSRAFPYLEVFEYLLQQGADASILTYEGWNDLCLGPMGMPQSIYDVCTDVGRGWKPGRLRRMLRALVAKYQGVPKRPLFRYEGPPIGPKGLAIMRQWAQLPPDAFASMPDNWVGSFGPGFEGADKAAAQPVSRRPWRPAGTNDGSTFVRPMTKEEQLEQEKQVRERARKDFEAGGVDWEAESSAF